MLNVPVTPHLDRVADRALATNVPLQALFELTGRCNLDCGHCYLDIAHPPAELSTEQCKRIIEQLADAGTLFLTLSGGEVLLRRDAVELGAYARSLGMAVRIFTNATRIDRALAQKIAAIHPLSVEISVYGVHGEQHDSVTQRRRSLRKTLRGALLLKQAGVAVGLKAPIVDVVASELDELYALADRMEMPIAFDPFITPRLDGVDAPSALRTSTERLAETLKHPRLGWTEVGTLPERPAADEPPCAIGRRSCRIDPEGNLYPCSTYPEPVGNLLERSFLDLWSGGPLLDRLRAITVGDLTGSCSGCGQAGYCTRCMAVSLIEHGDEMGPADEACRIAAAKEMALGHTPTIRPPLPRRGAPGVQLVQLRLPRRAEG